LSEHPKIISKNDSRIRVILDARFSILDIKRVSSIEYRVFNPKNLYIESEIDNVTIFDDVIFTFESNPAGRLEGFFIAMLL
jgi:hypothetical protein